ncbi:MAG: glutathione peroxidase [Bacilli bacterium]|nr:glutathione peroxidase [Bacilli bacterium]
MSVHEFVVKDQKGNDVSLKEYAGKVLLIVNTATGCGFTPQYKGLEELYEKYREQGFEILDFPCNQFFRQAPGSDEEINQFCSLRYNTQFPRFKKIEVNGDKADPLFIYLCSQNEKNKYKRVKWNFTKFLVDREGNVIGRFEPSDKPESFENAIKEALEK